jgi:predicted DNA-binding protein
VRLSTEVRQKLETLAEQHGVKASAIIRQAILEKLDDVERESAVVLSSRRGAKGKSRADKA